MKKKKSGFPWLFIILFVILGGSEIIPGILGVLISFGVIKFVMFLTFLPLIALILLLVSKSKKKKLQDETRTNVHTTEDLIDTLKMFSTNANEIYIDDETYLLLTNPKNIELDNVDIYMRNEYIGSLGDYFRNFPSSYNSLANKINVFVKFTNKSKKKTTKKVQEPIPEFKEPVTIANDKNCAYYIDRFNQLNKMIENTEVSKGIDETVEYLKQIKKIEDEYPESKKKTTKLYEYYLPMYAEILSNYDRLVNTASNSEEFKENESRLMKTSLLINTALKTISSSLAEDYYTEMNVNMKTLESVLKKDGLVSELQTGKENSNE